MPEGDVVYRTGRLLAHALTGKTLSHTDFRHPRLATTDLSGQTVAGIHTVGKHLFIRFSEGLSLHSHLRMDGAWETYRPGDRWRHPAHQVRAILATPDSQAVGFRVHDLALLRTERESDLVGHLGPDLLSPQWTDELAATAAHALASDPNREIGVALLDQRIMAGIGNLYKTEICFLLGVSPWTPVAKVDSMAAVRLARKLLIAGVRRNVQTTTGELARGRRTWVYDRSRLGCFRCGGPVLVADQGDHAGTRPTWFCPRCQPGPAPSF